MSCPLAPTTTAHTALLVVAGLLVVWGGTGGHQGRAQEADTLRLVERYRTARVQVLARQAVREGWRAPALPPAPVPVPAHPLLPSDADDPSPQARSTFPVDDVRRVPRLGHDWFAQKYAATDWAFLGTGPHLTLLDTTRTRDLRARLQAQFGDPTRTTVDHPDSTWTEAPQFEYWFVVNDSIPVRVSDARGPRGRGLVVATEQRLRDRLPALRAALLRPLHRPARAPYVDYYYDSATDQWYRTGYDGRSFFRARVPRSRIIPGRRAYLSDPEKSAPGPGPSAPDSTGTASH